MKAFFKSLLILAGLVAVLHNTLPHHHNNGHEAVENSVVQKLPLFHTILSLFELDLGEGHLEHVTRSDSSPFNLFIPLFTLPFQLAAAFLMLSMLIAASAKLQYVKLQRDIPVAKGVRATVRFRPPPVI